MPPRVASGSPPGAVWIIPILVCALHPLAETGWVTRFTAWLTWKERANKQLFRLAPHGPMSLITSSSTTSCGGEVNKPVMVFLHTKCLSSYFPVFLSNLFQVEVYYLKGSTDSQDVTLGTHRIKQTKTGPYLFSPWLMLASSVPPVPGFRHQKIEGCPATEENSPNQVLCPELQIQPVFFMDGNGDFHPFPMERLGIIIQLIANHLYMVQPRKLTHVTWKGGKRLFLSWEFHRTPTVNFQGIMSVLSRQSRVRFS